jgi:hypothetical protein
MYVDQKGMVVPVDDFLYCVSKPLVMRVIEDFHQFIALSRYRRIPQPPSVRSALVDRTHST